MENKKNIGEAIEDIVRKKRISITDFAKQINCVRKNVYDIFNRNNIDIELLARISEVLKHNFFADLADDYDLAKPTPIDEKEEERSKAVYQFFEVVPDILAKHYPNGNLNIVNWDELQGIPLPNYVLGPWMFTFTIGESIEEKSHGKLEGLLEFKSFSDSKGNSVLLCNNIHENTQTIDIKIDYKTRQEWEDTLALAFDVAEKYYSERTKIENNRMASGWYNF